MKLRIKGNSLRLRLTQTEVEQMAVAGYVEERISFGSNELVYALQSVRGNNELAASFEGHKITVDIPESLVKNWSKNDIITFSGNMPLGNNDTLMLLVEKDFKCIDATTEDQSDNYENPRKTC